MPLRLRYLDNPNVVSDNLFADIEFKRVPTNGNGGCAIHAVFGNTRDDYNQLILPHCREFLYEQLGPTAAECEQRVDDRVLFSQWIENDIWKDTVVPLMVQRTTDPVDQPQTRVEPERLALWNAIRHDTRVFTMLQSLKIAENRHEETIRKSRRHMVEAFGSVCTESLRNCFLHPLLKKLQIFEEFCEKPFHNFQDACPGTRLDAILASNEDADYLKQALLENKGLSFMHRVSDALLSVLSDNADIPTEFEASMEAFYQSIKEVEAKVAARENHAVQAFAIVYPVYLKVICQEDYWLSVTELKILCRCARQSVVICRRKLVQSELLFETEVLIGNQEPVFVMFDVDEKDLRQGKHVRSHFERLERHGEVLDAFVANRTTHTCQLKRWGTGKEPHETLNQQRTDIKYS